MAGMRVECVTPSSAADGRLHNTGISRCIDKSLCTVPIPYSTWHQPWDDMAQRYAGQYTRVFGARDGGGRYVAELQQPI